MSDAKRRTLQQFDLWSDAADNCIWWDSFQIARVDVPTYRKHHLHVRKLAHPFENGPVHVFSGRLQEFPWKHRSRAYGLTSPMEREQAPVLHCRERDLRSEIA